AHEGGAAAAAGAVFAPARPDGRGRDHGKHRADAAQPAADPASGRRAHRGEPPPRSPRARLRAPRALRLSDPAAPHLPAAAPARIDHGAGGPALDRPDRDAFQALTAMYEARVVSGMRPTGALHLGHFHGALKNWVRLQSEHPCLYFVADWHALTTHYETPDVIE